MGQRGLGRKGAIARPQGFPLRLSHVLYNSPAMPNYPHILRYRQELERLIEFGGSDSELNIRAAFQTCLDSYCREHRDKLALVTELPTPIGVIPDGTVKDSLRMARGYWEAKDTHDDLDAEIQRKLNRGYPRDNIIFEDSRTAVLIQNREEAMRVDMSRPGELHRLVRLFLDYELPHIEEFRQAQRQFKDDLPAVLHNLRQAVDGAAKDNPQYQTAVAGFLDLCRHSIGPAVSPADVREMLLQHVLTKDIFLRVFAEDQFHRENNVARQLDALEGAFFTGDTRRQAIDRLRAFYGAIGRAASEIADYAEKQQFLKAVYEDFYKAYNPAAADRLGVVYTPNEVVNFMIRCADTLLQKYFGRRLADDNVQILDPATGTGTFVTSLINHLPDHRLEYKYLNEIHANEVAILPYYIANLNIEYTYKERTGHYLEFPNLVFVDTLDNMDWQQRGATGAAVQRQGAMELGGLSAENWVRMQEQNEKTISVIIGNPPYNDSQTNWNEFNPNRKYPGIDQRIKDTYIRESKAQKTHQYDMYKRFLRWASDRLADDGIIAFITNRAYLDTRQDDGFRKVAANEFSDIYVLDLGSDVRRNPKIAGTTHNVFGIQTGVAIGFFVREKAKRGQCTIHYARREDAELARDKLAYLGETGLEDIIFESIAPDGKNNWLNQSESDFDTLIPVADNKKTKFTREPEQEQAIFKLFAAGMKSNRDDWVFDFDVSNLRNKALFFADTYNELLDNNDYSYPTAIKWSSTLRDRFHRGERIVYNDAKRMQSLYRPFVQKHYFAETIMNDKLTRNHYEIFGADLRQSNFVINISAQSRNFCLLATDKMVSYDFITYAQCLPLYRYTEDGERVSNITPWGLRRFREHYRDADISPEDIFAYAYAVLHHPTYLRRYRLDLLREFPRLPLYPDLDAWIQRGRRLLDLHIGFERVEPYPLERLNAAGKPTRVMLRANSQDKERGLIHLDDHTILKGIPPSAWRYRLGSRSALEWVLDQYKERKPRDPSIAARFNTYRFAHHKERVIDLLQRICTVSVETMKIVDGME